MANAHDVAAYILDRQGSMTAMKLQKLVYYSHAWHLVWDEEPLFGDSIEAWANGPVVRSLYARHRGTFEVSDWLWGEPSTLTPSERESINAVLDFYAPMTAHQLSELTHREDPWILARERVGAPEGARCDAPILDADMHEYYDSLTPAGAE